MARPRTEDIIASVEKYIQDNYPDTNVGWVPTAHEAASAYAGTKNAWVGLQWIGPTHQDENRNDIVGFDLRVLVYSREVDRLAAAKRADEIMLLLDDTNVLLKDRTGGGTTTIGRINFHSATATAPELDSRGVRLSVVETTALVYPS